MLVPWLAGAEDLLAICDGLLLAGGGDIAPNRYGSAGHPAIYEVDEARDAGELALLHAARAANMPILGICRGAQLINVALGGTLIEHLPDSTSQPHRAEPSGGILHDIRITGASKLYRVLQPAEHLGDEPLVTSATSWHHQAIGRLADGLVVTATAADGTVEAIESPSDAWLVAVQWHPELTAATDPIQQRLFNAFIAASTHAADTEA